LRKELDYYGQKSCKLVMLMRDRKVPPILTIAEDYFKNIIAPQANIIDRDTNILKKALQGMDDRSLLALRVPQKWGGAAVDEITFRYFQMMITRYSGALAFLQAQHQSAASQIAASLNESLKQKYLPYMGNGEKLVGVGFSQLRRQGKPLMMAIPTKDGYELNGIVPWITGYGFFEDFIIGATLPDGSELYGIVPFKNQQSSLQFSQPMSLAVMAVTNTVSAKVKAWRMTSDKIITIKPPNAIHDNDKKNVLHHGFYALGCAQAGLDILETAYQYKQLPFIDDTFKALNREINDCREKMLNARHDPYSDKLKLRAWAIGLAGKCSQAAVIVSSGAANELSHPAQRVYREALIFTVSGQTTDVMEETLKQLTLEQK
jgi:Acyl-CoA dehydrogenase, N-terminal domain